MIKDNQSGYLLGISEHYFLTFYFKDQNLVQWPEDFNSLHHVFRKHIKPKKKHEIIRMADVASVLSLKANKARITLFAQDSEP